MPIEFVKLDLPSDCPYEDAEQYVEKQLREIQARYGVPPPEMLGIVDLADLALHDTIWNWRQEYQDEKHWRMVSMSFKKSTRLDRVTVEANMLKIFGTIPSLCIIIGHDDEQLAKQVPLYDKI